MRLKFLLTALALFVLLAYFTHPDKRDEFQKPVVKQDFFYEDFIHGTIIAGSWIDQNYRVIVETRSSRLEMKLAFEFTESKGLENVNRSPSEHRTPKHDKIHKFNEFSGNSGNGTCTEHKAVRPRHSGMITYAWNKCRDVTLTMANKVQIGVTVIAKWIWNKAVWLAGRIWLGVRFVAYSFWNGVTIMAEVIWDTITRVADDVMDGTTRTAVWAWEQGTWLVDKIWNGMAWMGEWICYALKWTGSFFIPTGNFVTDAVLEFYHGYLDSHVTYTQARISASTWQDVLYMMSVVLAVNFSLLGIYVFLKVTVNFIRRLWKARRDRLAAANMPPAPKKPIWRPKPKKKRRKNKNTW